VWGVVFKFFMMAAVHCVHCCDLANLADLAAGVVNRRQQAPTTETHVVR
jgi:hypothetical protein